jgi:hypothetical protein
MNILGAHIECWEADDSGNEFYDKMVDILRLIEEYLVDAAVDTNKERAGSIWGGSSVRISFSLFLLSHLNEYYNVQVLFRISISSLNPLLL